jgi:hypothetical protein
MLGGYNASVLVLEGRSIYVTRTAMHWISLKVCCESVVAFTFTSLMRTFQYTYRLYQLIFFENYPILNIQTFFIHATS